MKIGVICGYRAEKDCIERAIAATGASAEQFEIRLSGSSSARAQTLAERLAAQGCAKLLSFGIAGGLDPVLAVGDIVFSNRVVTLLDEAYGQRPQNKLERLSIRSGCRMVKGSVCGVDTIAFTPEEKARLFAATRAAAADMESHAVAREAEKYGLPFLVLRAVSDAAADTLPAYVAKGVNARGEPQILPILKGLAANPASLPLLLRLKRNTDKALASLEEAATRILPSLL